MSASDGFSEPSLFDPNPRELASKSPPTPTTTEREAPAATATPPEETEATSGAPSIDALPAEAVTPSDRKRLAEQLDTLKRKEFELRRALAAADHPELAEAIRVIEGRAFAVVRAEGKLAQGFSKGEARRREVIEKKLAALRDKRAELEGQISALEAELGGLGTDRLATFENERHQALEQLLIALGTHDAALRAAGLDSSNLVPEIEGWLPELEALAKKVSA